MIASWSPRVQNLGHNVATKKKKVDRLTEFQLSQVQNLNHNITTVFFSKICKLKIKIKKTNRQVNQILVANNPKPWSQYND
jgi:hypothetical protein